MKRQKRLHTNYRKLLDIKKNEKSWGEVRDFIIQRGMSDSHHLVGGSQCLKKPRTFKLLLFLFMFNSLLVLHLLYCCRFKCFWLKCFICSDNTERNRNPRWFNKLLYTFMLDRNYSLVKFSPPLWHHSNEGRAQKHIHTQIHLLVQRTRVNISWKGFWHLRIFGKLSPASLSKDHF